ncbi:MAG: hypothetical protein E6G88_03105 [Alphaproteobacteria bacterium]|nr:MAG: hypothetical protein E6G88_03105 [Alphaproteobacteria bacterium]
MSGLSPAPLRHSRIQARPQEQTGHDAVRHCRSVANENQFVILACLQSNRPKLTAAGDVLVEF